MQPEKVIEWLRKTGFPLEMEAASAFRKAGFDVQQSSSIQDTQSDKGREIDVLVQDPDSIGIINISFVVECKSSSKPWVVFTADDALRNRNRLFSFGLLSNLALDTLSEKWENLTLLKPYVMKPEKGGYGFRQVLDQGSDPAYSAAIGALKACHGIVRDREHSEFPRLAFAFPIIVVDSPLFECSLKIDGELEVKPVFHSEFVFSSYIPEHIGCCVRIITKEYLPNAATWAKQLAHAIREDLKSEEEKMFASIKLRRLASKPTD